MQCLYFDDQVEINKKKFDENRTNSNQSASHLLYKIWKLKQTFNHSKKLSE